MISLALHLPAWKLEVGFLRGHGMGESIAMLLGGDGVPGFGAKKERILLKEAA
jgi:hypothetical protein